MEQRLFIKDALPEYSGVRLQGVLHLNWRDLLFAEATQNHSSSAWSVTAQEKLATDRMVFPKWNVAAEAL
jgi:hypothetical protein